MFTSISNNLKSQTYSRETVCMQNILVYHTRNYNFRKATNETLLTLNNTWALIGKMYHQGNLQSYLSSVLSKNKVVSAHAPVHAIDATKEWCTTRNLMHNNLNYFNIEINQPSSQKKIFRLIYYKGTGGTMVSLVY